MPEECFVGDAQTAGPVGPTGSPVLAGVPHPAAAIAPG